MAKENLQLDTMEIPDLLAQITSMENEYQQIKFDHALRG